VSYPIDAANGRGCVKSRKASNKAIPSQHPAVGDVFTGWFVERNIESFGFCAIGTF
jgi:hypothetical protein